MPSDTTETSERIRRWLRSPGGRDRLSVSGTQIISSTSEFRGSIRDDVAVMLSDAGDSFFDDKFHVMKHGKEKPGEWDFCYEKQTRLLSNSLSAGMLVLDVGCGPVLPYEKPEGVNVIGLEPSFHSIRINSQLDLRVFGTAYAIPLATASADAVVCFYAIHHMVGATAAESMNNIEKAFLEFSRVLKPNGTLFVFEMTPSFAFWCGQRVSWNPAKRFLGKNLDMRFISAEEIKAIGLKTLPVRAQLETTIFETSPFTSFAPVFSLPRLKVPRFMYPLSSRLYKWRMPLS